MKYLTYILGAILGFLSLFWFDAYLANHTYYFSMLSNFTYWMIVILGIFITFWYVWYFFESKSSWTKKLLILFGVFVVFSLILWLLKGGFASWWIFILPINYFIVFSFLLILLLASFWIGNLFLKNFTFEKTIYEIAIKLATWLSVLLIVLYYITAFQILYTPVAWLVFLILLWIVFYTRKDIANVFSNLKEEIFSFYSWLKEKPFLKWSLFAIFSVALWYVFIWFNYTFIPYPTAWDANHAYMFIPRVLGIYNWYPWNIDFRPDLYIWYWLLAWLYKLGGWTWFAPDTWMIVFNFLWGLLSLFFGFMLVSTLVRFVSGSPSEKFKSSLLLVLWYVLVLARLTSWNGAFLVFVDNKTDLAVLSFVILWLFLALYALWQIKLKHINKKQILFFVFLSWFFFAIANLIKPTATFDFFETTIVFTILEIGFLLVIALILFVVGLLSLLNFRGFDKAVSPIWSKTLFWSGFILGIANTIWAFFKKRFQLLVLLVFIVSFILTLVFTKGIFGLVQIAHWEKIVKKPVTIASSLIMASDLPVQPQNELTGSLYKNLKKVIGSSYNEDNGRYVGYGSKNFWNVWWSFIVPDIFKNKICVGFKNVKCANKIDLNKNKDLLNNLVLQIYNNKSETSFNDYVAWLLDLAIKKSSLDQVAQQLNVSTDQPTWKIKKEVFKKLAENVQNKTLLDLKKSLSSGKLNFESLPVFLQTNINKELINQLNTSGYVISSVSIPYKYLVPFNVVFNWSLQNLSSYYTDIGIVWLVLFFVVIFALFYGVYLIFKGILEKSPTLQYDWKLIFAFAFATLIWWTIWYFVASGIIWYNIGWIIWLIITTLIFLSKWEDKNILLWVIFVVSVLSIFLNLIRISSQGWGEIQNWYRSSVGYVYNYKLANGGIMPEKELKIPYNFDDVFHLQFNMYKWPIKAINNRTPNQMAIIGWTYMRYFVKNQNKILWDQFLMWLWRMGSDNNPENTYKRFKDNGLTDIVIDPNIATVVMGTWNISLWYRYFGKVDKNWNITEKGVLPMFVDLASKWYLKYWFTNNLGIKYALSVSDDEFKKATGITDPKKIRELRYYLTAFRFFPRDIVFDINDKNVAQKMYSEWLDALYKIFLYRLQKALKWDTLDLASDLMDINWYYIPNLKQVLINWLDPSKFDTLSVDDKSLIIQLLNILNSAKQQSNLPMIVNKILSSSLNSRAQLLFVKIK